MFAPMTPQGRTIPMPRDLARQLADSTVASVGGLLFTAPRGGPVRYTRWRQRRWAPNKTMARFDAHPTISVTRLMSADRWEPAEVQALLGHRDPGVTLAIHTHVTSGDLPTPSALTSTA
jgi:integrase